MIPHNYSDWLRCITIDCGIRLTPEFIAERLRELSDEKHPKTIEFTRLYSQQHRENVIHWFKKAQTETHA